MANNDRAVKNCDVHDLMDLIGVSNFDMRYALGATGPVIYAQIFSGNKTDNELDITRSFMVRYLSEHPEMWPIPITPSMQEVFTLINKYFSMTEKEFANLLGRHGTSGGRWLKDSIRPDKGAKPEIKSMLVLIKHVIESSPKSQRASAIQGLVSAMKAEAKAKGFDLSSLESDNAFIKLS